MSYDAIDGNKQGIQSGVKEITERKNGWVKVSMQGGAGDLWFKGKDISHDFDTLIIDSNN